MPYKDPEKKKLSNRMSTAKWYKNNKQIHLVNTSKNYQSYKSQLYDILGHECIQCGYSDKRALQFDHIHSDGKQDRESLGGSMNRYYVKRPIMALLKLQVLCANCNWIKRTEERELFSRKEDN